MQLQLELLIYPQKYIKFMLPSLYFTFGSAHKIYNFLANLNEAN